MTCASYIKRIIYKIYFFYFLNFLYTNRSESTKFYTYTIYIIIHVIGQYDVQVFPTAAVKRGSKYLLILII